MRDYLKLAEEAIKNKKHIIITGAIGSGKSTLLNALRTKLCLDNNAPGIITWSVPYKAVYMRKLGDDKTVKIGEFNTDSGTARNRMRPVPGGFDVYGISFLKSLIKDNSEWVIIDEIGFLEGNCQSYLEKLNELFEKKRLLATVRKQCIPHINDIIHREDAYVIDLDEK